MVILPRAYANQTMQSAMRRQRLMRKVRSRVVIKGDDCASGVSIYQVGLLFS